MSSAAMVFLQIIAVVVCAGLTRFIRQSEAAAPFRDSVSGRSGILAKVLSCPHCVSFWLAVICTLLLWTVREFSYLELGLFVLLGWRGAYFVNRQLDRRLEHRAGTATDQLRECTVCGAAHNDQFFERHEAPSARTLAGLTT